MAISIGTVHSLGFAKDTEFIPDDRQNLVKTFNNTNQNNVVVEDYGVCANGEVISLSATFSSADYTTLKGYWSNRTLVTVTLEDGTVINNARIVIKRTQFYDAMLSGYKTVQLEIWRV